MAYELDRLISGLTVNPAEYIAECDWNYEAQIVHAAEEIAELQQTRPIVLLTGPSGSGKTTTAIKLAAALGKLGIDAASVSMDSYFLDYDPVTSPRTPEGNRDMESPLCLDLELMGRQFRALTAGEEVLIPSFDFTRERRNPDKVRPLKLGEKGVAIFEGINALNDMVTEFDGVTSYKLYVSVNTSIEDKGSLTCDPRTVRLLRRMIRDHNYRGAAPEYTYVLWKTVLRGERLYIEPCRPKADMEIDTFLPYELAMLRAHLLPLIENMEEMQAACRLLERVPEIDEALVGRSSLVREFIGGSAYKY